MKIHKPIISVAIVSIMIFSAVGAGTVFITEQFEPERVELSQQKPDFSDYPSVSSASSNNEKFSCDFETWSGGIPTGDPDGFASNSGWIDSLYGFAHSGSSWAYSWGTGDTLTSPSISLDCNPLLSFWTAVEGSDHPMDLEIYCNDDLVFSDYGYTHTSYEKQIVDLSSYENTVVVLEFVGMTSDFYGQFLEDVLVIDEDCDEEPDIDVDVSKLVADGDSTDFQKSITIQNTSYPTFNITIENNADALDKLTIRDELPPGLYFDSNVTIPSGNPTFEMNNQKDMIWWNFTDVPTDWSTTIMFTAALDDSEQWCGENINQVFVTASNSSQNEMIADSATVYIECGLPPIEVDKTVRVIGQSEDFTESVIAYPGDTVEFRVSVHNPFDNYTIHWSGDIKDSFPCNLRYVNHSTVGLPLQDDHPNQDCYPDEFVDWEQNMVLWKVNKTAHVPSGGYLNFTYLANVTCDCGSINGSNNLTVSPDWIENEDNTKIIANTDRGYPEGIPLNASDSASVTVICDQPGISVDKMVKEDCGSHPWHDDGVSIACDGCDWVTFGVTVRNTGAVDLDVNVSDCLDPCLDFVDGSANYPVAWVDGDCWYWEFDDVGPGESRYIEYRVKKSSCDCGVKYYNDVTAIGISDCETVTDDDSVWVKWQCCDQPDISVVKKVKEDCGSHPWHDDGVSIACDGCDWVTFGVTVRNTGAVDLDVNVSDCLDPCLDFVDGSANYPVAWVDGDCWYWEFDDVGPGESRYIEYRVRNNGCDCGVKYYNSVTAVGESYSQGSVSDVDDVWVKWACPDDDFVAIEKLVKPDCQKPYKNSITFDYGEYEYVTYRLEVQVNHALWNLSINDSLPQLNGLEYTYSYIEDEDGNMLPPSSTKYWQTNETEITEDYIHWNFEWVKNQSHFYIIYCVNVTGCGTFENIVNLTAQVFPCCPSVWEYDSDSAIVQVNCPSGLWVEKDVSLDGIKWDENGVNAIVGDLVWFRITVDNLYLDQYVSAVNVTDYLPDHLAFEEFIDTDNGTVTMMGSDWWQIFYHHITDKKVIIFTARVVDVGDDCNLVKVSSCTEGMVSDIACVNVSEGMRIKKQVSIDNSTWMENVSVMNGDRVFWNVSIHFASADKNLSLVEIVVEDWLPEGADYVDGSSVILKDNVVISQLDPVENGRLLTWNLSMVSDAWLRNGSILSVLFATDITSDGNETLINWANVTARQCTDQIVFGKDSAEVYVQYGDLIDCEKLVRNGNTGSWADETTAEIGDIIQFKISMKNVGFGAINHINIEDDLPDHFSYVDGSSTVYYKDNIRNCEPIDPDDQYLIWEEINICMADENGDEAAEYLLVNETVELVFEVEVVSTGTAINEMYIDAKMCENAVMVFCSDTAKVIISIPELVADAGSYSSLFVDEIIELDGSAEGGVSPYNLSWDLDNDGSFDDATGEHPTHSWSNTGTYTIGLKVVDSRGENDTDTAQITVKNRQPDLYCVDHTFSWEVKPRSTINDVFRIKNNGDPESNLDWEIVSYPTWGSWSFSQESGTDLSPEDGVVTIDLTVKVPIGRNKEYTGEIILENQDDSSDTCVISITLAASKTVDNPLLDLIENLIERFPFLEWIFASLQG